MSLLLARQGAQPVALALGASIPVSWGGALSRGGTLPVEWQAQLFPQRVVPVEWSQGASLSANIPVEILASLIFPPTRRSSTPGGGGPISGHPLGEVPISGTLGPNVQEEGWIPVEWNAAVALSAQFNIPVDWQAALALGSVVPVEWRGAVALAAQFNIPVEWSVVVALAAQFNIPVEWISAAQPIAFLNWLAGGGGAPVWWREWPTPSYVRLVPRTAPEHLRDHPQVRRRRKKAGLPLQDLPPAIKIAETLSVDTEALSRASALIRLRQRQLAALERKKRRDDDDDLLLLL